MKLLSIFVLLSTATCIFAMPTPPPGEDCMELPRRLREGLFVLRSLAFQRQPNELDSHLDTFGKLMTPTPLEIICFAFDSAWDIEIGTGHFYNGSAAEPPHAIVDTVSERICSWISSLTGSSISPECGPTEVQEYCWKVRTSNSAHRAGDTLGEISGISIPEWIRSNLDGIDSDVLEYIEDRQ